MALTKPPVLPAWAEAGDKVQPTNAEIQAGWPLSNIPPARQRWNWILNFVTNGIRYLTRRGIADWAADETYEIGDCTRGPDGLTYRALTQNINMTPAANATDWERWGFSLAELFAKTDSRLSKNVAGNTDVTLTAAEALNGIINFAGALTGNINVIVPTAARRWLFTNNTTGNFTLTVKTLAGTGYAIPQGIPAALFCDGTNVDLQNELGATAPAGDNSKRQSTTEFVQQAIGQLSFRNKIINGDMAVSQVNGGNAVTSLVLSNSPMYVIDQFRAYANVAANKLTFQQVADAPAGFRFSEKITVAAQYAPGAAEYFRIEQPIEGQNVADLMAGTATPATIAVTVWVKGSVAGTYACYLGNGAMNRSYVGNINVTNGWTKQTVVLTLDNAGVWAVDNTTGLIFGIDLGSGANFNAAAGNWQAGTFFRTAGAVTFVNQAVGATLNITGVQLEQVPVGATSGTPFEQVPYADQLRRCQRYLPAFNSAGTASILGVGGFTSATLSWAVIPFPVTPRVPVTGMVASSAAHLTFGSTVSPIPSSIAVSGQGVNCAYVYSTVAGATAGYSADLYFNNSAGQIYFTGAQL